MSAQPPRFYYGWVIIACVWLANFVTVTMNPIIFAFFLDHMVVDLGLQRSTLVWGITIRLISGGLFAPYLGRFVDKHGSRWAGVAAGLLVGVVLAGFSLASNIWVLYGLFLVSGLTGFGIFGGNVLTMVPPANWFVAKRGRAVTIAGSGQLFGTAVFAILSAVLIEAFGWREAWAIFAVVAVAGTVPTYALLMRRRPEDMGLLPDGATSLPVSTEATRAAAAKVTETETQKAVAAAQDIINKARQSSEAELARMKTELRREVGRLVVATTAKVAGKILSPEDQVRLAEEANRQLAA